MDHKKRWGVLGRVEGGTQTHSSQEGKIQQASGNEAFKKGQTILQGHLGPSTEKLKGAPQKVPTGQARGVRET